MTAGRTLARPQTEPLRRREYGIAFRYTISISVLLQWPPYQTWRRRFISGGWPAGAAGGRPLLAEFLGHLSAIRTSQRGRIEKPAFAGKSRARSYPSRPGWSEARLRQFYEGSEPGRFRSEHGLAGRRQTVIVAPLVIQMSFGTLIGLFDQSFVSQFLDRAVKAAGSELDASLGAPCDLALHGVGVLLAIGEADEHFKLDVRQRKIRCRVEAGFHEVFLRSEDEYITFRSIDRRYPLHEAQLPICLNV